MHKLPSQSLNPYLWSEWCTVTICLSTRACRNVGYSCAPRYSCHSATQCASQLSQSALSITATPSIHSYWRRSVLNLSLADSCNSSLRFQLLQVTVQPSQVWSWLCTFLGLVPSTHQSNFQCLSGRRTSRYMFFWRELSTQNIWWDHYRYFSFSSLPDSSVSSFTIDSLTQAISQTLVWRWVFSCSDSSPEVSATLGTSLPERRSTCMYSCWTLHGIAPHSYLRTANCDS